MHIFNLIAKYNAGREMNKQNELTNVRFATKNILFKMSIALMMKKKREKRNETKNKPQKQHVKTRIAYIIFVFEVELL